MFDALMLLMDKKPFDEITVSAITKKAGIARQTFYRNYKKKSEVLEQYLMNIFNMESSASENIEGDKKEIGLVFTFDLGYMMSHKENLTKIMLKVDIADLFSSRFQEWASDLIDSYREKLSAEEYVIYRYKVYYQMIGAIYIIADWFRNDMPLPGEKLSSFLNSFILPDSLRCEHIPNIIIRLKTDKALP
jgi:AcrR family transcriptional regulator